MRSPACASCPPSTAVLAALVWAAGCTGPYPPPPETRVDPVVDVLHGVEFTDDYRWLEDQEAPETREWIAAQSAYAELVVGESPLRDRFRARLRELMDRDDVGTPRRAGDFEYFTMRRAGEEAPVLYRRPAPDDEDAEEPTVVGSYEVVLDPADLDPTYRMLVSLMGFSPDSSLMMYSIREGGSDEIEVRIRDLATGADLPDRLPRALYSGVDFDDDGAGFYYTHRSRTVGPRIRYHTLGTERSSDEEIWGEGFGPEVFISMSIVADGRYRIFGAQHGWARNDIYLQDVSAGGAIEPVVVGVQAHFQTRYRDGAVYVRTDWEAPKYRLMAMDPADPDPAGWREVMGEGEEVLQSYVFIDDRIYATYLMDVSDRVRVFEMDGTPLGELDIPPHSSVGLSPSGDGEASLSVRGYLRPPTEYTVDLVSGDREVSEEPDVPFDASGYEVRQIWFTSADGTRAPVYVMHMAGIPLDGSHPTILNGYGGFNSPIRPGFSTTRAAWVEMGGVYAVATLRGGSEYGETWHRDGMLANKQGSSSVCVRASM